ncbi:MAG: hypothetical protein Q4C70_02885 [Planctomycetia bacterium]|nr:hypothetical protein [Planctomycetia bacterium]
MASIYANKTYNSFVVEVSFINKRWRFWGFPRRSDAEKFGKQMEDLKTYHKHGLERPTPLVVWLDNLWKNNPEKYNLIVEMGLAEFREQCGTVGELIERFVPYAINGQEPKKRTSIGRRGACNVLLNFLARQKAGNFRRDARALKLASNIPAKEITPEIAEKFYRDWVSVGDSNG